MVINWPSILLWGFAATAVLTTLLRGAQGLGLTRMDIPFMLGSMVTLDRDRAKIMGVFMHFVNGWLFALVYAAFMGGLGVASAWVGAGLGLAHALFVLIVGIPMLPGVHPRMVSDFAGPDPTRLLEPPGFLVLNYGYRTPLATVLAHVVYGAIIGGFYRLP